MTRIILATTIALLAISRSINAAFPQQHPHQHQQQQHLDDPHLDTIKQWTTLSYDFPWDWPRTNRDFFVPEQVVATGIEVDQNRIFLATPRLFSGVPATLSVINKDPDISGSSILQAYPNWRHHSAGLKAYNCSDIGLVSVYRLKIDSCNRLWALDAGVSRSLEDFEVTCPPKILVYDLHSDQVVRRIDFPAEVIRGESLFTNLVIDDTTSHPDNNCDDVFIYITDTVEPAIVVYDSGNDVTWRLSHPSMFPDPDFSESRIENHRFTLMDGVVGIAFDKPAGVVYYQPLATDRLFSVTTKVLRAGPLQWGQALPVRLVGKKSSQAIGLGVSKKSGAILISPMTETALGTWNPYTNEQRLLTVDEERLQFVADIITPRNDPHNIYVLSSRFHRYFLKNLDQNDINVRIMRIPDVTKAVGGPSSPFRPPSPLTSPGLTHNLPTPTSYSHFSSPYHTRTSSLFNQKSSAPSTPYPFEPIGVVNKSVRNPFLLLNSGERPLSNNEIFPSNNRNYEVSGPHFSQSNSYFSFRN